MKKYGSIKHYIALLRRQPIHMQHVYAAVFSGSVTILLAAVILYVDYGFWRERYDAREPLAVEQVQEKDIVTKSPIDMLSSFFGEAKDRFNNPEVDSSSFFEGKEVYIREKEEPTKVEESTPLSE